VEDVKGRSIRNTLEMGINGGLKKRSLFKKGQVLKIKRKLEEKKMWKIR